MSLAGGLSCRKGPAKKWTYYGEQVVLDKYPWSKPLFSRHPGVQSVQYFLLFVIARQDGDVTCGLPRRGHQLDPRRQAQRSDPPLLYRRGGRRQAGRPHRRTPGPGGDRAASGRGRTADPRPRRHADEAEKRPKICVHWNSHTNERLLYRRYVLPDPGPVPRNWKERGLSTLLADHHHELRTTGLGLTAISRESPGIFLSVSRRARFHARMNGNSPPSNHQYTT
jgi:hypothetical protein